MKKYIFMTVMSMIVAGTAFAQETISINSKTNTVAITTIGNVTALRCDQASPENSSDSVFYKGVNGFYFWRIPYEGGDGGMRRPDSESSYDIDSYGVEGLMLSTVNAPLAIGDGYIEVILWGEPTSSGTAYFNITFAGKSCVVTVPVLP